MLTHLPSEYLLVEDIPCPSGSLGRSTCEKGVSWHPECQRAAVLNRPPQELPLGQPAARLEVIRESWANCRWFVGHLWWSNTRDMEGGKEDSMHLEIIHVIYLITTCLLIFVVWVFSFKTTLKVLIAKKHDAFINSRTQNCLLSCGIFSFCSLELLLRHWEILV